MPITIRRSSTTKLHVDLFAVPVPVRSGTVDERIAQCRSEAASIARELEEALFVALLRADLNGAHLVSTAT